MYLDGIIPFTSLEPLQTQTTPRTNRPLRFKHAPSLLPQQHPHTIWLSRVYDKHAATTRRLTTHLDLGTDEEEQGVGPEALPLVLLPPHLLPPGRAQEVDLLAGHRPRRPRQLLEVGQGLLALERRRGHRRLRRERGWLGGGENCGNRVSIRLQILRRKVGNNRVPAFVHVHLEVGAKANNENW